jgi:hypothetical protein
MNIKHDQFIGIYEEAFNEQFCKNAIQYFENANKSGFCHNRLTFENAVAHAKNDLTVFVHQEAQVDMSTTQNLFNEFNQTFWGKCYKNYSEKYSVLSTADEHTIFSCRVQKTEVGGGYHNWHFESPTRAMSQRIMAWMVYLNDVEEGGETEFLYLAKRVKPKAGTLVIWPAGYTHSHRGNPPISNTKYIITGWVEF